MMRCPPFVLRTPTSIEEAAAILHGEGPGATILAGGTDVIPGMKRRTQTPSMLVSLRRVAGLRGVHFDRTGDEPLTALGAGLTLSEVAVEPLLRPFRALQRAAIQVATPPIRNAATVGGNLCLDTRCNYYDQNYEWRKAIDFCMKRDGKICWVAPQSPRCWAVSSTDLAPALIALDAQVKLVSTQGFRYLDLADLYRDDGIAFLAKRPDELITEVCLGDPSGWRSTYWKLRRREAFDFPVLSVGAALKFDDRSGAAPAARPDGPARPDRIVREARLVLGAVGCRPVVATAAAALLVGRPLTDDAIEACADEASRLAKPLDNTDFAIGWRKRVARTYIAGALYELRGDDPAKLGLLARRALSLPLV